jgi:hypothetical protein
MQKVFIGILAAATLGLGILCAVQSKQLRAANERSRAAEQARLAESDAREAQAARLKELERSNQRLDQQVQQFTAVTTALRTNEARQTSNLTAMAERMRATQPRDGSSNENSGGMFGKGMGEMLSKVMKDPAMRDLMREQQKATVNMMYAGLFKQLNLSAEEKEKLSNVLVDSLMRNVENAQGIFGDSQKATAEDTQKRFAEAKKQTDGEIKALLGDERFAQYEDYQKNVGERRQLDQLKTKMDAANLPLQDQQMAQLLQIMKDEKTVVPQPIPSDQTQAPRKEMFTPENLDRQLKWMEDYNRRVLDRAGQVLTRGSVEGVPEFSGTTGIDAETRIEHGAPDVRW